MADEPTGYEHLAGWDLSRLSFEYRGCAHDWIARQEDSNAIAAEIRRRDRMWNATGPAAALARAILAGDESALPALIDAACEAYQHTADAERCKDAFVAKIKDWQDQGRTWTSDFRGREHPIYTKLRDLGYGEAVDEFLQPSMPAFNEYPPGAVFRNGDPYGPEVGVGVEVRAYTGLFGIVEPEEGQE